MTDKTTKLLLAAIALGLFANAFRPAIAQFAGFDGCTRYSRDALCKAVNAVPEIEDHLDNIERGLCTNRKLC
jgi:hypothetical protein